MVLHLYLIQFLDNVMVEAANRVLSENIARNSQGDALVHWDVAAYELLHEVP